MPAPPVLVPPVVLVLPPVLLPPVAAAIPPVEVVPPLLTPPVLVTCPPLVEPPVPPGTELGGLSPHETAASNSALRARGKSPAFRRLNGVEIGSGMCSGWVA